MVNITNTNSSNPQSGTQVHTGLSTQIIIKVNNTTVGALQELRVNQERGLERIKEIGTDGFIEIVPNTPTSFDLTVRRVCFDQMRLPEAFSRAFRFINSQRIPFDIEIHDLSRVKLNDFAEQDTISNATAGVVTMVYKNCWFKSYSTPYTADNYIITEDATIWAETAYVLTKDYLPTDKVAAQTDSAGIEKEVNSGNRLGSVDVAGLLNAVFKS